MLELVFESVNLLFKCSYNLLKLSYMTLHLSDILPCLLLDVPCSISVLESIDRLFVIPIGRGDTGNHHGSSASPEGVLQKPG